MHEYMSELARRELEEQNAREAVTFELPKRGPVSWDTLTRCAREAGMSLEDWVADALANYVRFHDSQIHQQQREAFGDPEIHTKRKRIPAWRLRVAERMYTWADRLTDDGCEK